MRIAPMFPLPHESECNEHKLYDDGCCHKCKTKTKNVDVGDIRAHTHSFPVLWLMVGREQKSN